MADCRLLLGLRERLSTHLLLLLPLPGRTSAPWLPRRSPRPAGPCASTAAPPTSPTTSLRSTPSLRADSVSPDCHGRKCHPTAEKLDPLRPCCSLFLSAVFLDATAAAGVTVRALNGSSHFIVRGSLSASGITFTGGSVGVAPQRHTGPLTGLRTHTTTPTPHTYTPPSPSQPAVVTKLCPLPFSLCVHFPCRRSVRFILHRAALHERKCIAAGPSRDVCM